MEDIIFSDMMEDQMRCVPTAKRQRRSSSIKSSGKSSIRRKIADWMLSIAEDFKCDQEVFSCAVSYLDRFLSGNPKEDNLYVLGATCIVVACKMFSRGTIHLRSLCESQDHLFTPEAIKMKELELLEKLQWDLDTPKPHDFLHVFLKSVPVRMDESLFDMVRRHAGVMIDMCYTDASLVPFGPAIIAATSLYFAIRENERMKYSKSHQSSFFGLTSHFSDAQQGLLAECIQRTENLMVAYSEEEDDEAEDDLTTMMAAGDAASSRAVTVQQ